MNKIKIGDVVSSKHGDSKVTAIEMVSPNAVFPDDNDNIPMNEIWESDKDRCVFSMANNHWSWGCDITPVNHLNPPEHEQTK